jgi:hypothetical protein
MFSSELLFYDDSFSSLQGFNLTAIGTTLIGFKRNQHLWTLSLRVIKILLVENLRDLSMKGGKAALMPDKPKLITSIAVMRPGSPEPLVSRLEMDVISSIRTPRMYVLSRREVLSVSGMVSSFMDFSLTYHRDICIVRKRPR